VPTGHAHGDPANVRWQHLRGLVHHGFAGEAGHRVEFDDRVAALRRIQLISGRLQLGLGGLVVLLGLLFGGNGRFLFPYKAGLSWVFYVMVDW
jgi:hypothetical protein